MTPQDSSSQPVYHDDEISLVDLAKILVKRWKAMAIIFGIIMLATLAYALLTSSTYNYTSIYNVAEQEPGRALESPASLVAKARNLYIGPVTRELLASEGLQRLPFELQVQNPEATLLITLTSQASETRQEVVTELHDRVLMRLQEGQQAMVERRRQALERQLQSAERSLEAAQQSESQGAAEVVASIMGRIAGLEASLEELRQGEVSQTAVQSLKPMGTSRTLIVALGIVLGGIMAVIGAFFMQFASSVSKSLREEKV